MSSEMILAPYDAMWRETGCAYRALEEIRAELKGSVEGLDQADLDRDPGHGIPSIGALLCHAGLAEAWWIQEIWRKQPIPDSWREMFAGGVLNPAKARPPKGVSAAAIFAWLDEVREATRLLLIRITDAELDRQTIDAHRKKASLRWVLFHLAEHEAHHRGQIILLRRLFEKPIGARRG